MDSDYDGPTVAEMREWAAGAYDDPDYLADVPPDETELDAMAAAFETENPF